MGDRDRVGTCLRFLMADVHRIRPRSAIVVGAGIVGLSTAWFLQGHGVSVTVVDRTGVAAGASWGNAGWIAPALSVPLNDPRTLQYALPSLPNPVAPVRISLRSDRCRITLRRCGFH